jgi:hypothetical protein
VTARFVVGGRHAGPPVRSERCSAPASATRTAPRPMRGRVWLVVGLALAAAGILAGVVPTWAAPSTPAVHLTRWSGGSDPGLHVMPFPGTPDASPMSEVMFSALPRSELRSVTVMGSRSGRHVGRLLELPDGSGTAFVPAHPFASSEKVRVTALLRSAADGTGSGARGARRLSFSFGVEAALPDSAAPVVKTSAAHHPSAPRPPSTRRSSTFTRCQGSSHLSFMRLTTPTRPRATSS